MTKYAIKANADNSLVEIVEFDELNSYATIKEATGGGWIDCVRIPLLGVDVWIDDEGKLVENPKLNAFGTALWFLQYGMNDVVVGDIIVTGGIDEEGNTLGMTREKSIQVISEVMKITKTVLSDTNLVASKLMENADNPSFEIIDLEE